MARKEIAHETADIPTNSSLLEKLKNLKNWETDDHWRKKSHESGEFCMWLWDSSGAILLEYHDYGEYFNLVTRAKGTSVELSLYDGDNLCFEVTEVVVGKGQTAQIEYHVQTGPFTDDYWNPSWGYGIHYGPDGKMNPRRNVKGLPIQIDTRATVSAFVDQLLASNFEQPRLCK